MSIVITKATKEHYKDVGALFDLYRQFYKYKTNLKASTKYIKDRINQNESFIFICFYKKEPAGFVQLYETFDSLNINKKLILYDLYVDKKYRKNGIGRKLMDKAKKLAVLKKSKILNYLLPKIIKKHSHFTNLLITKETKNIIITF